MKVLNNITIGILVLGVLIGLGRGKHIKKGDLLSVDTPAWAAVSVLDAAKGFYGSFFADRYGDDTPKDNGNDYQQPQEQGEGFKWPWQNQPAHNEAIPANPERN